MAENAARSGFSAVACPSEIAHTLAVSEGTVKTHIGHLLMKLGLRSRLQAGILGSRLGLEEACGCDHNM